MSQQPLGHTFCFVVFFYPSSESAAVSPLEEDHLTVMVATSFLLPPPAVWPSSCQTADEARRSDRHLQCELSSQTATISYQIICWLRYTTPAPCPSCFLCHCCSLVQQMGLNLSLRLPKKKGCIFPGSVRDSSEWPVTSQLFCLFAYSQSNLDLGWHPLNKNYKLKLQS